MKLHFGTTTIALLSAVWFACSAPAPEDPSGNYQGSGGNAPSGGSNSSSGNTSNNTGSSNNGTGTNNNNNNNTGSGHSGGDGGTQGSGADAGTTNNPGGSACIASKSSPGTGNHNPGADCLSCHATITGLEWTVAGTLFTDAAGSQPISGATIEIVDAHGQTIDLVTNDNGNFYTTQQVAFPVHPRASRCPTDLKMPTAAPQGSCNSCHAAGSRIHL